VRRERLTIIQGVEEENAMLVALPDRGRLPVPWKERQVLRFVIALAITFAGFYALGPRVSYAQEVPTTWTVPGGAYTLQWGAPWTAARHEDALVVVTSGSSVAVAAQSLPVFDINPSICLDAYIDAQASDEMKASEPVLIGKTSWRAYAAYENFQVGAIDYFECQITPDGQSFAVFAGGMPLADAGSGLPGLVDFMGSWVVREQGEASPALAADGWRLGIIGWAKGSVYSDLGLAAAESGTAYLIAMLDVTNWQAASPELAIDAISVQSGSGQTFAADLEASNQVARALGEAPLNDAGTLSSPAGETRRVALVFSVASDAEDLSIALDGAAAALTDKHKIERFVVLPPPRDLPALQPGVITSVTDGRTLRVEMAETGESERVRLIGLSDPTDNAAEERLATLIGQQVMLEADPAVPDDNRLQRYVWATGDDGLPVLLNALLIEEQLAGFDDALENGRFEAMLAAGQAHIEGTATAVDPPAAAAEPTAEELAYLTKLKELRDFEFSMFLLYDQHAVSPTFNDTFYGGMIITFASWATVYDDAVELTPPPAYADLHARYLAALEPFDTVAHQMEPELDRWFAGEVDTLSLPNFDYDLLVTTVSAARPELEAVLAEIDQALLGAGIEGA
jgi:hypothetical protein